MNTIELAYRQFSEERFPLPTEAELRALEKRIKVEFPEDYREFILQFNGGYFIEPDIEPVVEGCPEDALTFLCGMNASHEEAGLGQELYLSLFDDNDPPKILPIGGTPFGSLIILDVALGEGRGEIHFKQAFGDFFFLAEGIEEFFSLLRDPTPIG